MALLCSLELSRKLRINYTPRVDERSCIYRLSCVPFQYWFLSSSTQTLRADFLNAVYFRRCLTCTLGLTNDLIDDGQPKAKPNLHKAKPNHVLKTVFSPRLAAVYQVVG